MLNAEGAEPDPAQALLSVLQAAHHADLALAHHLGIGPNDVRALQHLLSAGPLGAAELAALVGVTPATATGLVDRLVARGHVRREAHPSDRRRQRIVATTESAAAAGAALGPLLASLGAAAATLDVEQRAAVVGYLGQVADALRAYRPPD